MSSETIPTELAAEDHVELQNPREEASFSDYYIDLDPESMLQLYTFSQNKIFGEILANSSGLNEYMEKQQRVDKIRQSRLKYPGFRKISDSQTSITDDDTFKDNNMNSITILEKLGFYNINIEKSKNLNLPNDYLRPDFTKDALIKGKLLYNSKHFQVHYDMDETDLLFINWVNEISLESVSMEQFEIIITFFENKIYQIERLLPPTIKDRSTIDYQQQQHAFLYGSDDGTGFQFKDEQACAVCDSSDCDNTNSIIFCDGCDIAVHQDCYGVSFIPEGPWLCRRCLIARNSIEKCIFCPSITGAFKQTDSGDWAHVLCTLWTPELYFANPIYMEPIEGVSLIPKSRWRLVCYICKQKVGACIQCSKSSCFMAYHVTCAKRALLYMKLKKGVKSAINDKRTLISYCDKHTPNEWSRLYDVKNGIDKTRLYFHDRNMKHLDDNTNNELVTVTNEERDELIRLKSEKFKWRLNSNVYVIPSIIINQLIQFNIDNKLPTISKITLNQIAKYFTLKRQFMGKPLIKRPDIFNHASLPEQELDNRDKAVDFFYNDMSKLIELSKLVDKRSKLNTSLITNKLETTMILCEPKKWVFTNLLSFFKNHFESNKTNPPFPKYSVKPTIYQILEKCDNGEYTDLETLINDIEKFSKWFLNLKLNANSILIETRKLFQAWQRYKKSKYQNSRENYQLVSENWDLVKSNFIYDNELNFSVVEGKNDQDEKINKEKSKRRSFKGSAEIKRLGIDISEFVNKNGGAGAKGDFNRYMRTRRGTLSNDKISVGIDSKVENSIKKPGTTDVLKARLNRVKLRTNVQNLRKSSRISRK